MRAEAAKNRKHFRKRQWAKKFANNAGQKQAKNVVGGTGAMKGVMGSGSCQGTVKSFNAIKGWGFIVYQGADVFVHIRDSVSA